MFGKFEPCTFEKWARFDSWPAQQAAFILMGIEPPTLEDLSPPVGWYGDLKTEESWYWALHDGRDFFIKRAFTKFQPWEKIQNLRDMYRALELAVMNQTVPNKRFVEDSLVVFHVTPTDVIQWARDKRINIPPELDVLFPQTIPTDNEKLANKEAFAVYTMLAAALVQQKPYGRDGLRDREKFLKKWVSDLANQGIELPIKDSRTLLKHIEKAALKVDTLFRE